MFHSLIYQYKIYTFTRCKDAKWIMENVGSNISGAGPDLGIQSQEITASAALVFNIFFF